MIKFSPQPCFQISLQLPDHDLTWRVVHKYGPLDFIKRTWLNYQFRRSYSYGDSLGLEFIENLLIINISSRFSSGQSSTGSMTSWTVNKMLIFYNEIYQYFLHSTVWTAKSVANLADDWLLMSSVIQVRIDQGLGVKIRCPMRCL